MKVAALQALVLLLLRAALVVAYGPSHGSELIAAYMEYLADGELHDLTGSAYQIAPGCVGAGSRCTLKEFALYVFAGKPGLDRPTNAAPWNSILDSPLDHSIGDLSHALDAAQVNVKDGRKYPKIPSAIAPTTFKPSVSSYTQMVKKMGGRVLDLRSHFDKTGTLPNGHQSKILTMGKDAVQAAAQLRFMDLEKFRLPDLRKKMPDLATKRYTIELGFGKSFDTLDTAATEAKGYTLATITGHVNDQKNKDRITKGHWVAFSNTKGAAKNLGCTI